MILLREVSIIKSDNITKRNNFDIKGALALALSITFFLLTLSYLEIGESSGSGITYSSINTLLVFLAISIISIIVFIRIEKKSSSPLIDLKFIINGTILPILIIFSIMGFTMFMIYQTIPILVREPEPNGFGGNTLTSSIYCLT